MTDQTNDVTPDRDEKVSSEAWVRQFLLGNDTISRVDALEALDALVARVRQGDKMLDTMYARAAKAEARLRAAEVENESHRGKHPTEERIFVAHTAIDARRARGAYKQNHDEQCYICAQADDIAALAGENEQLREIATHRETGVRLLSERLRAAEKALEQAIEAFESCEEMKSPDEFIPRLWIATSVHRYILPLLRAALSERLSEENQS